MARCAGIEPCTLVMDLEGTDGRERGEVPLLSVFEITLHKSLSLSLSLYIYIYIYIYIKSYEVFSSL